ncbi:TPA: type IV secretion system DNA-binding domain-containing protein, partial [Legionella pneumophila]|nr:type IV secretion system DNA-binding domain-containing protein [Legionella pneumophila]
GTAAATLVSNKIEKTAISIRSVITTYLKSMQSLNGLDESGKPSFSIRDYLLNKDLEGWLFISSNGEQHKSLKPLISMWIAMASLTLLSLPEDANRRIWFICDELPSLHKLPLLGETIAEVRKFGGCFLLGMQSFSQLEKVYGRSGAAEIFDLLNTRAFFASPSHEMAQLVSKELGDEEIDDTRENYSYGANSIRDGISL